jgi:hypothetical protein
MRAEQVCCALASCASEDILPITGSCSTPLMFLCCPRIPHAQLGPAMLSGPMVSALLQGWVDAMSNGLRVAMNPSPVSMLNKMAEEVRT